MAAINRLRREGCLLWRNRQPGVRQVEWRIYSMIKGSVFETGVKRASTQGCYQWTIRDGQNASWKWWRCGSKRSGFSHLHVTLFFSRSSCLRFVHGFSNSFLVLTVKDWGFAKASAWSHIAAARKRGRQWSVSLTPNNSATIERMTCHCFLRPIRSHLSSEQLLHYPPREVVWEGGKENWKRERTRKPLIGLSRQVLLLPNDGYERMYLRILFHYLYP